MEQLRPDPSDETLRTQLESHIVDQSKQWLERRFPEDFKKHGDLLSEKLHGIVTYQPVGKEIHHVLRYFFPVIKNNNHEKVENMYGLAVMPYFDGAYPIMLLGWQLESFGKGSPIDGILRPDKSVYDGSGYFRLHLPSLEKANYPKLLTSTSEQLGTFLSHQK